MAYFKPYVTFDDRRTTVQQIEKVSKGAKIRNRYNQVPHLTQDTNGEVTKLTVGTTNESQEVSPFPAGDHRTYKQTRTKAYQTQDRKKTYKIHKRSTALERLLK